MGSSFVVIENNPAAVSLKDIPVLEYQQFFDAVDGLMTSGAAHCLTYFVLPWNNVYQFICFIADDTNEKIFALSHKQLIKPELILESITAKHFPFHIFEREIHEEFGINFSGHPWLKPVRYAFSRADRSHIIDNYNFFHIDGEELHEVGVGPIHAGIIEPGYFRFICNGEKVLHLEIQLGYQHRGVEQMFIGEESVLKKIVLSENITGDTAIGHALCHIQLVESLAGISVSSILQKERTIALELERIAIHIGDTSALCADIAYQFGQAVNEALRTIVINTMQQWCGNRFGKGLLRTGGSHYPLTSGLSQVILLNLTEVEKRYLQMADRLFSMPSVLSRFESTGKITTPQAALLGAVGMAARSSGLKRDIRWSHPFQAFRDHKYEPVILEEGDVWARSMLRKNAVEKSFQVIRGLLSEYPGQEQGKNPRYDLVLTPATIAISATEGWRGEIVHTAVTDEEGKIIRYKIKDPSVHNWMALAIAMRNQEISDFPLCNKSYNLSYCGHDL